MSWNMSLAYLGESMVLDVVHECNKVGKVAIKPGTGNEGGLSTVMPSALDEEAEVTVIRTDPAGKQECERIEA